MIGNPLETTLFLSHRIFDGVLERFPNLKVCAAHGGGYLPCYPDRKDHGCLVLPDPVQVTSTLEEEAHRIPEAVLCGFAGASHLWPCGIWWTK